MSLIYALGMGGRTERPSHGGRKGKKAPFEVHFAVWALLIAILGIDALGVLVILGHGGGTGASMGPLGVRIHSGAFVRDRV